MRAELKRFSRKALSTVMAILTVATSAVIAVPSVNAASKDSVSIYHDGKEAENLVISQKEKATLNAVAVQALKRFTIPFPMTQRKSKN